MRAALTRSERLSSLGAARFSSILRAKEGSCRCASAPPVNNMTLAQVTRSTILAPAHLLPRRSTPMDGTLESLINLYVFTTGRRLFALILRTRLAGGMVPRTPCACAMASAG